AFLLIFIGYEFLTSSIERFQNQDGVVYGTLALVITVISILGKEAMAQFAFHLGRKHDNPVISADGWHHRTDSLSSVVVLIGIIIVRFFPDFWWMDSVLGMFCALAIFYAAFEIMKVAIKRILGEQPSAEFLEKLNVEVNKVYGSDLKMHHVHLHNYITQKELTLHIRLQKDMTIEEGHVIASKIEQAVKDNFDMIATIHVEPLK
ncbi:MAG: cation diffusion facilitator family transporter, partial [Oscillospiraceae bacterium]|nr:cation diffusion facilitator family transporter [Oscillospiraceae bacterium]